MVNANKVILGIDPGSICLGYGLIVLGQQGISHLKNGVIKISSKKCFSDRLLYMALGIKDLLSQHSDIHEAVVENVFLGKNPDVAFKLGHLRGVCLSEILQAKLPVFEYTARSVKQGVVGSGRASKETVRSIIVQKLNLKETIQIDASDALAIAYYHATHLQVDSRLKKSCFP